MFKNNIIKHFKINYMFYTGLLIILYILSKKLNTNIFALIYSFIFAGIVGYLFHLFSHKISFEDYYNDDFKQYYNISNNSIIDNVCEKCIYVMDFHRKTHHNTDENKKYKNLIIEFIENFTTQGLIPIFVIFLSKFVNYWIFILWGLTYATIHIFNYNIYHCKIHEQHHINSNSNLGIDLYDILFNSKFNNEIENINHYLFNYLIIGLFIYILNFKK